MNERGKHIDKTHLSIDAAENRGFIHRDYIAHCLRWSHVMKFLGRGHFYRYANILDVGCGKEVPLAKTMYSSKFVPLEGSYTGIDVNTLEMPEMFRTGKFPIKLIGNTDVCGYDFGERRFNVITCFEVLEHVEPAHSFRILNRIRSLLDPETGIAFISTPVYDPNVGAAANHVNEMSFEAVAYLISKAGLTVQGVYGTFASQRDIEPQIGKLGPAVFDAYQSLKTYYDSNYLATVFAPLFPRHSRNALWRVMPSKPDASEQSYLWKPTDLADPDHSSSMEWPDFVNRVQYLAGDGNAQANRPSWRISGQIRS